MNTAERRARTNERVEEAFGERGRRGPHAQGPRCCILGRTET